MDIVMDIVMDTVMEIYQMALLKIRYFLTTLLDEGGKEPLENSTHFLWSYSLHIL